MNHKIIHKFVLAATAVVVVLAGSLPHVFPARAEVENAAATCSVPKTVVTADGNDVVLDQCYGRDFDYGGTTYDVLVYYTEDSTPQNEVDGEEQCTADEAAVNFCEHALPDDDVPGTDDNLYAVQVADQAAIVLPYYFDRDFPVIDPETFMEIYITEDGDNGWIGSPNFLKLDDEYVASTNVSKVRANVFHESQHLIQEKYNDDVGWRTWFTEGLARTSQDRTDATYDADTGSSYMSDFSSVLSDDNGYRSSDVLTLSYRATPWWTWFMDQYKTGSEGEPGLGWSAVKGYYEELPAQTDSLDALEDYLVGEEDSTFTDDFLDYTLALYAYIYNPSDSRLGFLDAEINAAALGISNHTVVTGNQAYAESAATLQPRSSQYWEYIPPANCPFVAFTFSENDSSSFAFSILTVDTSGDLQDRWTSYSEEWARTVSTSNLSRVAGVVTGLDGDPDSAVTVGHGCVSADLEIIAPSTEAPAFAGEAANPRQFQVRLQVTGQDGSSVGGLTKDDFNVELLEAGGASIPAGVMTAAYVGDNYWLNVQAPSDLAGAQSGDLYDLRVTLAGQDDTEPDAVLYEEREVDKLIVLDHSGSMSEDGRIEAARNAAALMTFELSAVDQGAYIRYSDQADLISELEPMGDGNKAFNMALAISGTVPDAATCIGCGLQTAAAEHDADGDDNHFCVIALLSDGYENVPPYLADVEDEVADNACYMDVIGLGSEANEALLEAIASSSAAGGNFDFSPTSGDVPIDTDAAGEGVGRTAVVADVSWQNYLSRAYDAIVTRASGRQRIMGAVGNNDTGANPGLHTFMVDPTTDELVVSVAWQDPESSQFIRLIDPDGVTIPLAGHQVVVEGDTAEVWRVIAPEAGNWTVLVRSLPQQYHVSASARTLLEMQLYSGVPEDNPQQGVKVPIVVTFSGNGDVALGAEVSALVTNPSSQQKLLTLYDDGLHGDMDADDGVYANWYTQTTGGEVIVEDPVNVEEGNEPQSRGSYLVQAVGTWMGLRREAQTGFMLREAEDGDGDGFPDWWEGEHGLDPEDPTDPQDDPDGDGLPNRCEWQQGTNPNNPDTDGGGESDGSEVPNCNPGDQDPLDSADDRLGSVGGVFTSPEARPNGTPYVNLWIAGLPPQGVQSVDVYRRPASDPAAPWMMVGQDEPPPTFVEPFSDEPTFPGPDPQYLVIPQSQVSAAAADGATGAAQVEVTGAGLTTAAVPLSSDPYPPTGSVVIAEDEETTSRFVTLLLSASDAGGGHGELDPEPGPPGTPPTELEMILSTNADFSGASWRPFQAQVEDFFLGNVQRGETVTVYVRFRDQAGNVSDGFEESASIRYNGLEELLLPVVVGR